MSRLMRVLAIRLGSYSFTGGIERACRDADRILTGAGMDLAVVSLWDKPEDMPVSCAGSQYYGCSRSKLKFLWRFLVSVLACRWDVVWVQHRLLVPLMGVVRLLTRAKIMIWVFGWEVWSPPSRNSRFFLKLADRVLSISSFTARKCESLYGVPHDRMCVCPLGLSQALEKCEEESVSRLPGGAYVLVVSRLELPAAEQKGVLRVCEAMVKVGAQVPAVSCVVVGDGPARQIIESRVRDLGVADRVVFTGRLSDAALSGVYRKAAVFALPSTVEGFGLVYVEAMAHRVPVVAGNSDAAADVVVEGKTGLLVDPLDVDAVAQALVSLLEDSALREKMGEAGYDRVQKEFTPQAMGQRLLSVFEEMAP